MDTSSEVQRCVAELGLQSYSSVDLKIFTSNFIESNKLGSGGYGEVYKGQLPKGILVAVKVLEIMDVVEDTFMAEVCTMGMARHRNLIKLYGYCFEDNMKALVYEYMENGSLDKILYENHCGSIEWVKLYGIANDIANGLNYLHEGLEEQIIHYDVKAANVILGKNFSAKLTDFGLAKIMNRDMSRVDVSRIRGTHGYIAPEIWTPGSQVSCKCDVYSFGMMLFEILGRRSNGKEKDWFPIIVWKHFENGTLDQLLRDCGITKKDKEKAIILSKVALCCAHHIPERRPSMMEVVLMLKENSPVRKPSYPFLLVQFSNSSIVPSQEEFPQVSLEVPFARSKRIWVDSLEQDPAYPSCSSITGGGYNGPEVDGGVTLPQLKSNVPKELSPNILEDDLATLVPNKGIKLPTTILVGKTTALKYKEIILQLIAKVEVVTIGVLGMGGVGKTTILKHVHNQLLAEGKRFDKIIWVTVSKDGNITKLQNDLAKELDLNLCEDKKKKKNLCEDDVLRRSRLLFQALEKKKRVVFFFDDMWKKFSLDEIGIPEPNQENEFKLILTTRLLDVCRRMGCHEDNTIKVEGLPKDEAWELFTKKIDCVLTSEVEEIVEMVVKKCSGLPLAIITVGGAMRGNSNINDWRVALNDLNLKDPNNQTMDIKDDVFKCLKFSYDRLENEKQRKCFLCCALYPEDWEIESKDLVDFWIMDGIVEERNRQDELVKGQYILNKLKDHCLLETVDKVYDEYNEMSDGVKMHDLIREMALRLTNKCFLVKGPGLKKIPNEEEWEIDLERASFMDSKIAVLSISPICPKLSILVLRDSNYLTSVRHDFFVHMKCLKVLDLRESMFYNHGLELLPDSISDLVNLHVLRLGGYKSLKKLPSLAKLVLLRKLELNNTGIEELPEGMEVLVNLRCINLHRVQLKERIPLGLISKFSALQELYLGGINVDKLYDIGSGESFVRELLSLNKLENLSVTFHCLYDYASYVGSPKFNGLKCFYLATFYLATWEGYSTIGLHHLGPRPRATIKLYDPPNERTALSFLQNTKRLEITSFQDVELSATCTGRLRCLEVIRIDGCTKLYTIFEGIPNYTSGVLPVFCLKKLSIYNCHNLKNIFPSPKLFQLLQNLEEIEIASCNELEELIGDEEEETETPIAIPRLKYLSILNLPKLKRIWRGVMICDSLETVSVRKCFELKRLPRLKGEEQSTPPPSLSRIYGTNKWWDSLEWDLAYPKNILQPFYDSELEEEDLVYQSYDEDSSQSDECASEGAGIDKEKTFQLDVNVPIGFVCHNCEMYAIVGMRYRCKDCWEKCIVIIAERGIGFDLCEECYNTPSKHSDLVNHHHTQGHTFELIASDGDSSVPEVLKRDLNSQSDGEDNLMSEGERRSQSDECGPEGAGIDRELSCQSHLIMQNGADVITKSNDRNKKFYFFLFSFFLSVLVISILVFSIFYFSFE